MRDHPLVLLLDDEDDFLEIASVKLQTEGFETIITHSVEEALTRAEETQPDLILSDIYMPPGPNGWEFALTVRSDPKLRNIKFAFFTSLRDPMTDIPQSERSIMLTELHNVPVFSKTDDVDRLGKAIADLIN